MSESGTIKRRLTPPSKPNTLKGLNFVNKVKYNANENPPISRKQWIKLAL
jgi:hypothetical protein